MNRPPIIKFQPYPPDAQTSVGEKIFIRRWAALMGGEEQVKPTKAQGHPFCRVLNDEKLKPDNHNARVATNFIRWLGSDEGQQYLRDAKNTKQTNAFYQKWMDINLAAQGISAPRHKILAPLTEIFFNCGLRADHDDQVLERMARWLGTREAKIFIVVCQAEIRRIIMHNFQNHSLARRLGSTLPI